VRVSLSTGHSLGPDGTGYFDHLGTSPHVLWNAHFTPRLYPGFMSSQTPLRVIATVE
jgi:hypothetical protein